MDESVIKHLAQPKVGTLKLSEAIRIGARIRPQADGIFDGIGTCAIGAAYEGVFGVPPIGSTTESRKQLLAAGVWPPSLRSPEVFTRNDEGQSRESIADWLEAQGY